MNIYCEQCGEPYHHQHVLDVLPGIRDGSLKDEALQSAVYSTEGYWWKFWFVYREMFFEGNYKILLCPACLPDVGQTGDELTGYGQCKACFGHGRVIVKKAPAATSDPNCRDWFYTGEHKGNWISKWYAHKPLRRIRAYFSEIDGRVYEAWGFCPECFKDADEYWAAMTAAGWTEPEPPEGVLAKMARERK